MNWIAKVCLALFLSLLFTAVHAQSDSEYLSNPFPLSNAKVPYPKPVTNVMNRPEKSNSEQVLQVIRNAFISMGINLESNVLVNEGVDAYVDGYDEEQKIGFVLLDHRNMDNSYVYDTIYNDIVTSDPIILKYGKEAFQSSVQWWEKRMKTDFRSFKSNKISYITIFLEQKVKANTRHQEIIDQLKKLAAEPESEEDFNTAYIAFKMETSKYYAPFHKGLHKRILNQLDARIDDSIEKIVWNGTTGFFTRGSNSDQYLDAMGNQFEALEMIASNDEFLGQYSNFYSFNDYSYYSIRKYEPEFVEMEIKIMQDYPISEWLQQTDQLQVYQDDRMIPYSVAKQIDENNKSGKCFIAPICVRDRIFTERRPEPSTTDHMNKLEFEKATLTEEMRNANGMTKEIRALRLQEYNEILEEYPFSQIQQLPLIQKDSLSKIRRIVMDKHNKKYKDMQKLTLEERQIYRDRIRAVEKRITEEKVVIAKLQYQEKLKILESEVINYIKWAQSQMGN